MYWQLPLDPESQELFTIVTHREMYTPTRVLMGAMDAVAFCQGSIEIIFGALIYNGLLAWLNDILGYVTTPTQLMDRLELVLQLCRQFGLKLLPKKCNFFLTIVKWCGKLVSAAGVEHCPERINGLVNMTAPTSGADLQQFLCAFIMNYWKQRCAQSTVARKHNWHESH